MIFVSTANVYPLARLLALLGRIASTSDVHAHRKNERFGLAAPVLILSCWEYSNPFENFIRLNENLSVNLLILHSVWVIISIEKYSVNTAKFSMEA